MNFAKCNYFLLKSNNNFLFFDIFRNFITFASPCRNVAKHCMQMSTYKVIIIGAGASGCFCAVEMKRRHPDWDVCLLESAPKPMMKLAITGGGRCNLTNSFEGVKHLKEVYPRGEQLMRRALRVFDHRSCMDWWEKEGVRLHIQEDGCVFPQSQDAMQLVRTLSKLMLDQGVTLLCGHKVVRVEALSKGFKVHIKQGTDKEIYREADRVVLSCGGCSKDILRRILPDNIKITDTVASLFTLKLDNQSLTQLCGTVVQDASLSLSFDKDDSLCRSRGILLITDWGISGPATLKLSSYAARLLAAHQYKGYVNINWLSLNEEQTRLKIAEHVSGENAKKYIGNCHIAELSDRLWRHILSRAGIREDIRCCELGKKNISRLTSSLCSDRYDVIGRSRFKEEFVTCGGVDLNSININTLESKEYPGLYFTGEVLDIDAVTGGFNLQAAWSCGYIVAD